jgi:hypothetical protein
MPIEAALLRHEPEVFLSCPKCGNVPFRSLMRGQVQRTFLTEPISYTLALLRSAWTWTPFPYCAVICCDCGDIVGWEAPPTQKGPNQ